MNIPFLLYIVFNQTPNFALRSCSAFLNLGLPSLPSKMCIRDSSKSTLLNLETMRSTLDRRLEGMRRENQESMEQIRKSVDEQLARCV